MAFWQWVGVSVKALCFAFSEVFSDVFWGYSAGHEEKHDFAKREPLRRDTIRQ